MKNHRYGNFESVKFAGRRQAYYSYIQHLRHQETDVADILEHIGAYIGHMSLNRIITLYELFCKTKTVAGHIADVGVYKGGSALLFAKLLKLFQPESLTQVHGFDWFEGTPEPTSQDSGFVDAGTYKFAYDELMKNITLQDLDNIIRIHNFDIIKEIESFFLKYPHLQFRLVFLDAGAYSVMQAAIPQFWARLTPGGIMVFDRFSHELAPGETVSVRELLPNARVQTLETAWMPNAFVVKD